MDSLDFDLAERVKQALNLSEESIAGYYSFNSLIRYGTSKEDFHKNPITIALGLLDVAEEVCVGTIKKARERILLMKEKDLCDR